MVNAAGTLTVDVRDAAVLGMLRNGAKRISYAVANAINATAKDVQRDRQRDLRAKFAVRRPDFMVRQAAVISAKQGGGFANAARGRLQANIVVGERPRLLLSAFEQGADRRQAMSRSGYVPRGRRTAVPLTGGPARPSFGARVPPAMEFRALQLRVDPRSPVRRTRSGKVLRGTARKAATNVTLHATRSSKGTVQWKGAQRTFILSKTKKLPDGGVFQRVGPTRDDIRLVYPFKASARLERKLGFVDGSRRVALRVFRTYMAKEIKKTLAFNRGG